MRAGEDENENEPLWLSHENDHLHQSITRIHDEDGGERAPLFGSGSLALQGEVDHTDGNSSKASRRTDAESQLSDYPSYGSTQGRKGQHQQPPTASPPHAKHTDDSTHESVGWSEDESGVTGKVPKDSGEPHRPNRIFCLDFFRIVAAITFVGSLALLVTQLIPLFLEPLKSQGIFDLALKAYVALFCILFMLAECDVPLPFIRKSTQLQNYVSRGFLYSFLGLIGLQEAYSERVKELLTDHVEEFHVAWVSLFIQVSSWLIFVCGISYILMGICCLKRIRDRLQKKEQNLWKTYHSELKRWKRENRV